MTGEWLSRHKALADFLPAPACRLAGAGRRHGENKVLRQPLADSVAFRLQ